MGPGTYFLRIILEGGRGDNMRNINSHKKDNLTSECGSANRNNDKNNSLENEQKNNSDENHNLHIDGDNDDNEEEEEEELEVEKGVHNELEHAEDREGSKKKGLALLPPNDIERVIFCSGKVINYLMIY